MITQLTNINKFYISSESILFISLVFLFVNTKFSGNSALFPIKVDLSNTSFSMSCWILHIYNIIISLNPNEPNNDIMFPINKKIPSGKLINYYQQLNQ